MRFWGVGEGRRAGIQSISISERFGNRWRRVFRGAITLEVNALLLKSWM